MKGGNIAMKVPVLVDLGKIEFQEKPKPEAEPHDVLVKVEYCGICGSDVHGYLNGMTVQLGTVMGHECSGVVAEVGKEVQNVQIGERVWIKPAAQCGECYWCQRGQYMRCLNLFERVIGLTPKYDGAFAEYLLVKYPKEMLFELSPKVSFEEAALIEPLAVGLHGIRRSRFNFGDRTVVIGAGMIGLGVIQFLKLGGAGKIIALEISPSKSKIAKELGADVVLNPISEGHNLGDQILSLTDGIGADIFFECSGAGPALQNTLNYISHGGQIILIGLHEKEVPFNFWTLLHREVEVKGSLGYINEFNYIMELFENKKINAQNFISDVISLTDLEEKGFKRLLSSQDMVKILVRPEVRALNAYMKIHLKKGGSENEASNQNHRPKFSTFCIHLKKGGSENEASNQNHRPKFSTFCINSWVIFFSMGAEGTLQGGCLP
jgi:2-desacetyl-2-hydroxyethyl bacteriochlorophyllide A dehydrogenase